MAKKNTGNFITPMILILVIGFIIICAGIYFQLNSLSSSGVTMGKYGKPYGKGTLDGKGMIFCGIVICGFGLMLKGKRKNE